MRIDESRDATRDSEAKRRVFPAQPLRILPRDRGNRAIPHEQHERFN